MVEILSCQIFHAIANLQYGVHHDIYLSLYFITLVTVIGIAVLLKVTLQVSILQELVPS